MQEALHLIHAHDDRECNRPECWPHDECSNESPGNNVSATWIKVSRIEHVNKLGKDQVEEDFRKLSVSKRKGPKSKVRSSIGDSSKNEFDSLNKLVNEGLTEAMFMILGRHFFQDQCETISASLVVRSDIIGTLVDSCVFAVVILFFIDLRASWRWEWVSEAAWNRE